MLSTCYSRFATPNPRNFASGCGRIRFALLPPKSTSHKFQSATRRPRLSTTISPLSLLPLELLRKYETETARQTNAPDTHLFFAGIQAQFQKLLKSHSSAYLMPNDSVQLLKHRRRCLSQSYAQTCKRLQRFYLNAYPLSRI